MAPAGYVVIACCIAFVVLTWWPYIRRGFRRAEDWSFWTFRAPGYVRFMRERVKQWDGCVYTDRYGRWKGDVDE